MPMTGRVAIIGAGPAGLMAAETIAASGLTVTVYDRMASPARKFLLAGRGGLNLSHSEPFELFATRYGASSDHLRPTLEDFDQECMRRWCADLGIETFVGSSGRVFPTSFKASPLLRAWLRRLAAAGVAFEARHRWCGWTADGSLRFETTRGECAVAADATVLALGGASWPQLGSDGAWSDVLAGRGIELAPLEPSNCGFRIGWSDLIGRRFEGVPLKNISLRVGSLQSRGDAVITRTGLEGGAVYPLAPALRDALSSNGQASLALTLRPDLSTEQVAARLARRDRKQSTSTALRKHLGLTPLEIALLHEGRQGEEAPAPLAWSPADLANRLQAIALPVLAPAPIERAISTAGGVRFAACDNALMVKRQPGLFVAGEMLDWEAPTGGYLLQACFATGRRAGIGLCEFLGRRAR